MGTDRHGRLVTEMPPRDDEEILRRFAEGASLRELSKSKNPAAHAEVLDVIRRRFRELADSATTAALV
jgi:hypothetical protein